MVLTGQRISNGLFGPTTIQLGNTLVAVNSKPSWDIGNIFNKWTGLGILAWAYGSKYSPKGLPYKSAASKFKILVPVGVVSGLLDDAVSTGSSGVAPPAPNAYPGLTSGQSSAIQGWSK
jgi:hypothetical protein